MVVMSLKFTVVLLIIICALNFAAGGITLIEKVKLVILPGKVGSGWNMDEVDYLLSILEEQALELGRFQLFPRSDLQKIIKRETLVSLEFHKLLRLVNLEDLNMHFC